MRLAVAQVNSVVGDLDGNARKIVANLRDAEDAGADIVIFGELALTGYPPEDLTLRPGFVQASRSALQEIAKTTKSCIAVVGYVDGTGHERTSTDMAGVDYFNNAYNAVAVCENGNVSHTYRKRCLPNYDVFDEMRQFRPDNTTAPTVFDVAETKVGVTICEDAWVPNGPLEGLAAAGAQVVINVSASPFRLGKQAEREAVMAQRAIETGVTIIYVNLVGGQDDLIFDGGSFTVDASGELLSRCPSFNENLGVFNLDDYPITTPLDDNGQLWKALVVGTRDYVHKSGFSDVAIGLSGGIDSSLVAAIAVDALGADHVHGVMMPSRYSSDHSITDAEKLVANLGIDARTIEIESAHAALSTMLEAESADSSSPGTLSDQNLQSRIRGTLLMGLANAEGWLVLTTGNKSEIAVGYSTLYGDTAGAYSVICDLFKTDVYALARWHNSRSERAVKELFSIPENILNKAPSAELAPDQRDDQSLPPYEVLDPILRAYIEDLKSPEEIITDEIITANLAPASEVQRVVKMVNAAEYKRRQSPLGPRLSKRAFGRDRRMPIVNHFR